MKNKFTGLLLIFVLAFAAVLSGCSLFPRNMEAYLNKSVCTITYADGTKDEITTESYISAFNSYGYSLVQNGTSYEDAKEQTLDVLINRYVLLNNAQKVIELDDDDKKEIYDDAFTSLKSNLNSYVSTIRTEWKLDEPISNEEESEDVVLYKPFENVAEVVLVDGEYKIKLKDTTENVQATNFASLDAVVNEFKAYSLTEDGTKNSEVRKEAYRRLIAQLKRNEEGRNLSKDADSILKRYAEKLYKNAEENLYITKMEEYYKVDGTYSTITVAQLLNKYKTLVLQSKFKYNDDSDAFNTAMLGSLADVNYFVNKDYFYVSHILLKFNETQQKEYDNLEAELNAGYIQRTEYNSRLKELVAQIKSSPRDAEGKLDTETKVSANQVLTSLRMDLDAAHTDSEKAEIFRNYMYMYSEDPGTQNAEYPYVIGVNDSKMVESFTDASRELHEEGTFGAISGLVASQYGVHIIFYEGGVENLFEVSDVSTFALKDSDVVKLTETLLNPLNNKTVFDKVFALLSNDNYSIFENMNLNILKKDLKIEKHASVYKDM